MNASIHANQNICRAKTDFCKPIESNEKNETFDKHPLNDSKQPKPSGPKQVNEENTSSIIYPLDCLAIYVGPILSSPPPSL